MNLTITVAVVLAATALTPAAALASGGHDDKGTRVTGKCTDGSSAKLKVKRDDGRLETEFEVDQNRNGVTWKVTLRHGSRTVKTNATTKAPSGSFSVERRLSGSSGKVTARATSPSGEVCTASATV